MGRIDWKLTGLIPTDGLIAWHAYDPETSTSSSITDLSDNGLHLAAAATAPVLTADVLNGEAGWFFNGSAQPFKTTDSTSRDIKHAFILASATGSAFDENRGLLSGKTVGSILVSNNTGTAFFNLYSGDTNLEYRKSDTVHPEAALQAPMNERPELLEWSHATTGIGIDGIQIGQQLALTARKWKGYFFDSLLYNRKLTTNERRRVMLYFNIRYGTDARGVPLYFPSDDLFTAWQRNRYYEHPPEYEAITESWEYEDAMHDFNEVAPAAPRRWEYAYHFGSAGSIPQADAWRGVFDRFNDRARRAKPFYFRDKYGDVWDDVRIEDYQRQHEGHKSWIHTVVFTLRSNTGVAILASDPDGGYIISGGGA